MNEESIDLMKHANQYKDLRDYKKSQECIDKLIESDSENHLAWYEKSQLPIIQEDGVTYKGRTVSISKYLQLSSFGKHRYLQKCGYEATELQKARDYLNIANLLEKQRFKYLEMAIRYAPNKDKIAYESERDAIIAASEEKSKKDNKLILTIGIISLVGTGLSILKSNFINVAFDSDRVVNTILMFVIPFVLSMTGVVLYTRTKNDVNRTTVGFLCNLLSLILGALSMILAVVLLITKVQ